ncbi:MAG: hypothetical protein HY298_10410 [Verrucomicrobia bacterium]|nr:hypothetical protein [Verrucomicrobiota bacterium]
MTQRAVQTGRWALIGGLLAAFVLLVVTLHGQQRGVVISKFRFAEPYDPPLQNQTKYLLMGAEGRALGEGKVLLKEFRMETFARNGDRQTISSAPECVYDTINRTVSSAGPMQMQTADGKFFIQGEGFLLRQTNLSLVISNKVETTIHKELLASPTSQLKPAGEATTNSAGVPVPTLVATNAVLDTNQFVKIFSQHADFSSVSNLAVYSGNVRAVDPKMELTCAIATAHFSTNGSVENVLAETNVVITGRQDNSRATGESAVYLVNAEQERIELMGNAHWQDDQRAAKADKFIFDRQDNTVRAEPNAYLKLPRAALSLSGPLSANSSTPAADHAGTNEIIEITSKLLTMQLPTTNRPARVIIARTNVLIFNPNDQSRATGDEAIYTEADGTVRLSGKANWSSNQRVVSGDTLTFDQTNQVFTAHGDGYLKLPLAALGKSSMLSSGAADSTNRVAKTNQFVEVFSDDYDYRNNLLSFRENVRANLLEGDVMNGWMTCGLLTVEFTNNQMKTVVARRNVAVGQVPGPADTARKVYKKLNCEILTINLSTNGQAESFLAEEKVVAVQDEVRPGTNDVHTTLRAEVVTGYFFATTNQLEKMIAERNVYLEQGERSAKGAQAVYTATNNLVELTGEPTATLPGSRISKADSLIWDRADGKLTARGIHKSEWRRPPANTNQTNLPFPR